MHDVRYANQQSLSEIIAEIRAELKEFVQTRVRLAITELSEAAKVVSGVTVAAVAGILFALTAYVCFIAALTVLIASALGDTWYSWPAAFGIMCVFLLAVAGIAWAVVQNTLHGRVLLPEKTIEVLKADTNVWNHHGEEAYE